MTTAEVELKVKGSYVKKLLRIQEGIRNRGDKPQTVHELRREIES